MSVRDLNTPASRLFVQQFVQAGIKGNIKGPHHWPYVRGIRWLLVDLPHKGPVMRNALSCQDVFLKLRVYLQYIPRNMHTVFALLCFVVVLHWLIFPYPSGLLHWHCGNLTIAPVPAKQPWWIWINTSCELIMNDCITTTKPGTTKPCVYFLGYTVCGIIIRLYTTRDICPVGIRS